jgi:hypothetical protein
MKILEARRSRNKSGFFKAPGIIKGNEEKHAHHWQSSPPGFKLRRLEKVINEIALLYELCTSDIYGMTCVEVS